MSEPLLKVEHLKTYFHTNQAPCMRLTMSSFTPTMARRWVVGGQAVEKSPLGRTILRLHERRTEKSSLKGRRLPLWASWR
jgi:peptide/nickel transport system ATP-binding protein